MTLNKSIGVRIKAFRNENNITQIEFALSLGISQEAVSSIENGKGIKLETLVKISYAYKKDLNWLIIGNKNNLKKTK